MGSPGAHDLSVGRHEEYPLIRADAGQFDQYLARDTLHYFSAIFHRLFHQTEQKIGNFGQSTAT